MNMNAFVITCSSLVGKVPPYHWTKSLVVWNIYLYMIIYVYIYIQPVIRIANKPLERPPNNNIMGWQRLVCFRGSFLVNPPVSVFVQDPIWWLATFFFQGCVGQFFFPLADNFRDSSLIFREPGFQQESRSKRRNDYIDVSDQNYWVDIELASKHEYTHRIHGTDIFTHTSH